MNPHDHPLFKHYPLSGKATISTGQVPMPYHIYDGYGLFIGGMGDLAAVKRLLQTEAVMPVQTTDGQAVLGIWVCNFTEASLGPHHELQFSIFVTERESEPIAVNAFNALSIVLTRPDVRMLCHGLWNNTPNVVAYNRELLSLNARLTISHIERTAGEVSFAYRDAATDAEILSGVIHHPQQTSPRALLAFMSAIGVGRSLKLAQQPWVSLSVINPRGVMLDRNAAAATFTKNDVNVVRYFDRRVDTLEFGDTPYRALGFSPQCMQYMSGFKFVYLQPE